MRARDCVHEMRAMDCIDKTSQNECVHKMRARDSIHKTSQKECVHKMKTRDCVHKMRTRECVHKMRTRDSVHKMRTRDCVHRPQGFFSLHFLHERISSRYSRMMCFNDTKNLSTISNKHTLIVSNGWPVIIRQIPPAPPAIKLFNAEGGGGGAFLTSWSVIFVNQSFV